MVARERIACMMFTLLLSAAFPAVSHAVPNIRLTNDASASTRPRVALDQQSNVIVVWEDGRFGNTEILWQKFDQQGHPLSAVVRVTKTAAASLRPDVSCDGNGNSHIVWQEGENVNGVGTVFFCRLDPSGNKILNDVSIQGSCGHARVSALADGSTDIVYYQSSGVINFSIFYKHYAAAGSLTCSKTFGNSLTQVESNPVVATLANGTAQIVWRDFTQSFSYQLRTGSVTSSCSAANGFTYDDNNAVDATIAASGSSLYRLFTFGGEIQNWTGSGTRCAISQGTGQASAPSVAGDAGTGYATWRDARDGNGEIYFCRFSGCSNLSGDTRLTNQAAASETPDIAVDPSGSGNWVVVWRDDRDGNSEIYLTSRVLIDPPIPADPSSLTAAVDPAQCPPRIGLTWTDNATTETSYEVQSQLDNGGIWAPEAPAGANATAWTSGPLTYGHSYAYRIRACNSFACSAWLTSTTIAIQPPFRVFEGLVTAKVMERPFNNTPTWRPLPYVQVSLLRNGQPVASTFTDPVSGIYQLNASAECDDVLGVVLANDRMHILDNAGQNYADCDGTRPAVMTQPLPAGTTLDFQLPVTVDGISGDAANLAYLTGRMSKDYWQDRLHVQDSEWYQLTMHANVGTGSPGSWFCSPTSMFQRYGAKWARYKSGVAHEFSHRMIFQKAHSPINALPDKKVYPQAAAMDEGIADFFAAAYDEDPGIHPIPLYGVPTDIAQRTLSKVKLLNYCNGQYVPAGDEHLDGWVVGGALWDWRQRLTSTEPVTSDQVDKTVYDALPVLVGHTDSERTFPTFLGILRLTALGTAYPSDLEWAFERHNLTETHTETCKGRPTITSVVSSTVGATRQFLVKWSSVAGAFGYRVYARRFGAGGQPLVIGDIVADSLADTTFVHSEPDSSTGVAFVITTRDSEGDDDMASDETPVVTAVEPITSTSGARSLLRVLPNPTHGPAWIELTPGPSGHVWVRVHDVAGRLVRRLRAEAPDGRGALRVWWDGRSDDGRAVGPGIYLIRLESGSQRIGASAVIVR